MMKIVSQHWKGAPCLQIHTRCFQHPISPASLQILILHSENLQLIRHFRVLVLLRTFSYTSNDQRAYFPCTSRPLISIPFHLFRAFCFYSYGPPLIGRLHAVNQPLQPNWRGFRRAESLPNHMNFKFSERQICCQAVIYTLKYFWSFDNYYCQLQCFHGVYSKLLVLAQPQNV